MTNSLTQVNKVTNTEYAMFFLTRAVDELSALYVYTYGALALWLVPGGVGFVLWFAMDWTSEDEGCMRKCKVVMLLCMAGIILPFVAVATFVVLQAARLSPFLSTGYIIRSQA